MTVLILSGLTPHGPSSARPAQSPETPEIITDTLELSAVSPIFESETSHVFGAIAYSDATQVYSSAIAWIPEAAAGEALHQCQLQAQANDCAIKLEYQDGWGALAISNNGVYGVGISEGELELEQAKAQAHAQALQTCQASGGHNCRILYSRAAMPDSPTQDLTLN